MMRKSRAALAPMLLSMLAIASGCSAPAKSAVSAEKADGVATMGYADDELRGSRVADATASPREEAPPTGMSIAAPAGVKAGEWDDNANYRDFLGYLRDQAKPLGIESLDVSNRQFIVVRDADGHGVPNCEVRIRDDRGNETTLTTSASGRVLFFPHMLDASDDATFTAKTSCLSVNIVTEKTLAKVSESDPVTVLDVAASYQLPARPVVDVAFVLDTTGSMSEEIQAVKDTLKEVVAKLDGKAKVRVGLVEYKDRGDEFITKPYAFTSDLSGFSKRIDDLYASGGGDMPEDVEAGLNAALHDLEWSSESVARLAFLIADAPPHLDYSNSVSYASSAQRAAKRGIKVFTVSASGMDALGQAVFRQVAQATGGTNMFVLRGGAGPASTGGGDPTSSCGTSHEDYSSANLDQLIVGKISEELTSLRADPLRIAGRGQDENAKPCDQRIQVVAR
ncbi:MAG: vWA domain-containing protein [Polyangiaceae bacterium]